MAHQFNVGTITGGDQSVFPRPFGNFVQATVDGFVLDPLYVSATEVAFPIKPASGANVEIAIYRE